MSLEHPAYWLAYVPESTETGTPVITAVAPEVMPRQRFSVDACGLLAAADAFHVHHPNQHVVFAGAVTRGEVPFDDWWERCLALDARLEEMLADESIPEGPARPRIESWSVRTHLVYWLKGATA